MTVISDSNAVGAASAQPEKTSKLSFSTAVGFGIGTIGVSILLNTVSIYFPALMVTVLGFSPAIAGYLLTGSKLYDIGADLAIGAASDRTRSRWGRRRPYLLAGAIIGPIGFLLLFNLPPVGQALSIALIALALVIYSTGYSLFNVPYLAMPSEMTDDYHERTYLLSYRTFFVSVGQLAAISGAAALLKQFGGNGHAYTVMSIILAAGMALAMFICFFGTRKVKWVERPVGLPKVMFLRHARLVFQNRPFITLMAAKFCSLLSLASVTTTQLLFLLYVTRSGYEGQLYLSVPSNIALAVSLPIWVRLARWLGKRPAYLLSAGLYGLTALSWLFAHPYEPLWFASARGIANGLSSGGILLLGVSMLPDTMEYDFLKTGLNRAGIFSSIYAIVEKLAFAIGPGIMGVYLAAMNFIPTKRGIIVDQPPSAIQALYIGIAVIPAILSVIAICLMLTYGLDEKKLKTLRKG